MRTNIKKVADWVMNGGEPPFKKKTMLKCIDQLKKRIKKALEEMETE